MWINLKADELIYRKPFQKKNEQICCMWTMLMIQRFFQHNIKLTDWFHHLQVNTSHTKEGWGNSLINGWLNKMRCEWVIALYSTHPVHVLHVIVLTTNCNLHFFFLIRIVVVQYLKQSEYNGCHSFPGSPYNLYTQSTFSFILINTADSNVQHQLFTVFPAASLQVKMNYVARYSFNHNCFRK